MARALPQWIQECEGRASTSEKFKFIDLNRERLGVSGSMLCTNALTAIPRHTLIEPVLGAI